MTGFLIRRILQALLVLFLVTVFTLALVHLFPGGPIRSLLGPRATPEQVAYYNRLYGFDQPFYVQYLKWVGQLLHGNLGYSPKLNQTVTSLIAQDLPKTIVPSATSTMVLGRSWPIRLATDWLSLTEKPKLPWKNWVTHLKYCR